MNAYYLACDVGGTQLRAALYAPTIAQAVQQKRIHTVGKESATERLMMLIADIWPSEGQVLGIGIGVPGMADPETGIVYKAPNIAGWENLPLQQQLQDRFGVPVVLGNDANVALLGEWRYGAGRGHHNLLYFTISTGIGGAAIIEDQLLLGEHGLGTEMGHLTILPDGPLCGCGQRGHLEALASGTGIAHYVAEQLAAGVPSQLAGQACPNTRQIAEAAHQGDALARSAFERAGFYLGMGLANYLHIFNPSIVIFGGGVSQTGELIFAPMRASLEKHLMSPQYLADLEFAQVQLGDDAGLVGAYVLAQQQISRQRSQSRLSQK